MKLFESSRGSYILGLIWPLLVIFSGGCADIWGGTSEAPKEWTGVKQIAGSSFHEECLNLRPGQALAYSFESAQPVQFNIHYHEGEEALYPVSKEGISGLKGTFRPAKSRNYCFMWSNSQSKPVKLSYEIRLVGS